MTLNHYINPKLRLLFGFLISFGLLVSSQLSYAQELSVDELPGDWEVGSTWDASGTWDSGGGPTSGVTEAATIRGDIYISGALDYSHTTFSTGLTIQSNDTLTIFGNLTFTSAIMTIDIEDNGVLKVYGDFDTNGSTVSIVGDGVIVISGDLTIDGGSVYSDNAGGDDLYVDGTITGTGNGGDFSDLSSNHPTLYSEVQSELPVELIGFDGTATTEGVRLNWSTASEENFDYFEIQQSANGRNYTAVDQVPGHGNSSQILNYEYMHKAVTGAAVYYRLMAVDYDGSYEILSSIRVDLIGLEMSVNIFPNPVLQYNPHLRVEVNKHLDPQRMVVFDPRGRVMIEEYFNKDVNYLEFRQTFAKGVYHIRIQTTSQVLVKKFLVN